jgi:hypothetical protein
MPDQLAVESVIAIAWNTHFTLADATSPIAGPPVTTTAPPTFIDRSPAHLNTAPPRPFNGTSSGAMRAPP